MPGRPARPPVRPPARPPAPAAPQRRPRARRRHAGQGSRHRIVAAARAEFARRGFAGANVDRIARAAGVNKAMIYYHFTSKAALYQDILVDMFHAVAGRVRVVAGAAASPRDKIKAFVVAIADEAEARPHFPPIWFREIADGGAHVAEPTLAEVAAVVQSLVAILHEGIGAGQFTRVNPLVLHGGIIGPLLLFFASAPLRRRFERSGIRLATAIDRDEVVAYVQRVSLGILEGTT